MKKRYQQVLRKIFGWKKGDKCSILVDRQRHYGIVNYVSIDGTIVFWVAENGQAWVSEAKSLLEGRDNPNELSR